MYEDGYQYQSILGPLVTMEAEEDKRMKERQREDDVRVEWNEGLSRKPLAKFRFARYACGAVDHTAPSARLGFDRNALRR